MPRLTNDNYLAQRAFLRDAWNDFRGVFACLTYNQQLELHEFYGPSQDWDDEQALLHRQKITEEQPSLPQRAGKLYARLFAYAKGHEGELAKQPMPDVHRRRARAGHRVRIGGVIAIPEPDLQKLAKALLNVARSTRTERGHGEIL